MTKCSRCGIDLDGYYNLFFKDGVKHKLCTVCDKKLDNFLAGGKNDE